MASWEEPAAYVAPPRERSRSRDRERSRSPPRRRADEAPAATDTFPKPGEGRRLYIGGLNYRTRDDDLREAFEKFGTLVYCKVMTHKETDQSRGFGFITFADKAAADAAAKYWNEQEFQGRRIRVSQAQPKSTGGEVGRDDHGGGGSRDFRESDYRDYGDRAAPRPRASDDYRDSRGGGYSAAPAGVDDGYDRRAPGGYRDDRGGGYRDAPRRDAYDDRGYAGYGSGYAAREDDRRGYGGGGGGGYSHAYPPAPAPARYDDRAGYGGGSRGGRDEGYRPRGRSRSRSPPRYPSSATAPRDGGYGRAHEYEYSSYGTTGGAGGGSASRDYPRGGYEGNGHSRSRDTRHDDRGGGGYSSSQQYYAQSGRSGGGYAADRR